MELLRSNKAEIDEMKIRSFDIFITSCGNDWRSIHILQQFNYTSHKKIAFQYTEYNPMIKDYLVQNGFSVYSVNSNSINDYLFIYNEICKDFNGNELRIIFDYSSMPQAAYGSFVNFLTCLENGIKNIIVYFALTQGNYLKTDFHSKLLTPESMFSHISGNNHEKRALILGVNHNDIETRQIIEYFNADECFLFLPKQPNDEKYYKTINDRHQAIKLKNRQCRVSSYFLDNIDEIDRELTAICLRLRLNHKIIIMSQGPESFSLSAYLLYSRYPDIEIWHTFPNINELPPIDLPIIHKTIFTSEGDDY